MLNTTSGWIFRPTVYLTSILDTLFYIKIKTEVPFCAKNMVVFNTIEQNT